jgi:glycosyltransferase involved in cell wall biosynthesis
MKINNFPKKRIAIIATTPKMIRFFLINHIVNLSKIYNVTIISNFHISGDVLDILPKNVEKIHIPIERKINLFQDISTLMRLIFIVKRNKFSMVYSISPKGGLIGMMASWLVRTPIRVHTFTGQVWVTSMGIKRNTLKFIDLIISKLSTNVIVDSKSQQDFLLDNNIITKYKSTVIGSGSISGVDLHKFHSNSILRKKIRSKLNIHNSTVVFLFVGRLKKDKGVFELTQAFVEVFERCNNTELWFVGDDEENLQNKLELIAPREDYPVKFFPYTTSPEKYMSASDVFCLPSYREGFGSVVIESAACKVPSIGSNIYGLSDAIINGVTGFLVDKKSVSKLKMKMIELATNRELRVKMGLAAHQTVIENFSSNEVTKNLLFFIQQLFNNRT